MCQLVPGRRGKNNQTVYMEKSWLAPQGHPPSPAPPSQLYNFSCRQFAAVYKETYELSRPGWLGMEGNPPTRDNSPPYKQALTLRFLFFHHRSLNTCPPRYYRPPSYGAPDRINKEVYMRRGTFRSLNVKVPFTNSRTRENFFLFNYSW